MRNIILAITILCSLFLHKIILAQNDYNPVTWEVELIKSKTDTITVIATANIDEGWHLYALEISDDPDVMGPLPLEFNLDSTLVEIIDNPVQISEMITHFDKSFEIDLNYFEKELILNQKVKVSSQAENISGNITYMVCDDEKCMFPPEYIFEIKITK